MSGEVKKSIVSSDSGHRERLHEDCEVLLEQLAEVLGWRPVLEDLVCYRQTTEECLLTFIRTTAFRWSSSFWNSRKNSPTVTFAAFA